MRFNAIIAGVGMTRFMKYPDKGLKQLGTEATQEAVKDAGLTLADLDAAYVGNCAAGLVTGQESIRGQVILDTIGVGKIPIFNVENACASGSSALFQACAMVSAGLYDVVLALGKGGSGGAGQDRSMFMDIYAEAARTHMAKYGTTKEQFARVSAKNSFHGSLNPRAQFHEEMTVEQVLNDRLIVEPLTRSMCAPIGDGAAAAVVVSERKAKQLGISKPVRVVTMVMHSGYHHRDDEPDTVELCAREAYEEAGVGPKDLSVVEVHDASAPAEIIEYEAIGLCPKGEGGQLVDSGATKLGGRIPVNTSGGLLRKGHPVGATGIAQIFELTEQLQGRCGKRQVEGAKLALAQNGGGKKGNDAAAMLVTILER
jgi:acetyl-CoA acetyltransferase